MTNETDSDGTDHLEATHCPFCGLKGTSLFTFVDDDGPKVRYRCETHGEFEILVPHSVDTDVKEP